MSSIIKIIKFAKPFHKLIILLSAVVVISAIVTISSSILIKYVVDELQNQITGQSADLNKAYFYLGLMFSLSILGVLLDSIGQRIGDYTSGRLGRFLTEEFYRKIFQLPQRYFDSQISGKIVNQLSRGIVSLQDFFQSLSNFIFPAIIQTIFIIVVLAFYSWPVAILAFSIFPIFLFISNYSTKKWGKEEVKKNMIEDHVRGRIQEVIYNMKLVRSFNNKKKEWDFVSSNMQKSVSIYDKQSKTYHLLNFARNFGLELIIILIIAVIFNQTFSGSLSFGGFVLILQLLNQLRRPLFAMSFILERIQRAEAGSKEFFEILDLPSVENFETKKIRKFSNPSIAFNDVSFSYTENVEVLKNTSFELNKKEIIALVGHSGSGKTTIVNLILKLYEPTMGSVKLSDVDYKDLDHDSIRSHISLVFQDSELFSTTIAENVSYGISNPKEEDIIDALKKANAWGFVSKFAQGINTEVGERGIRLSGGQKQRIQIARALMNDSPILIFDEATSSLDAKSEKLVQNALHKLMKNRLVIIIAHRFSTLQDADKVLVIDNGKIIDSGTPKDLARRPGIYSELLKYQVEGNNKLLEKYELY